MPDPVELLEWVAAWYAAQIRQERCAGRVDRARVDELAAAWRAAARDRRALMTAGPAQAAAIEARYVALYRALGGP